MVSQGTRGPGPIDSDTAEDRPPKPPATWRPLVFWTAAILVFLGLAWFVGAVAVPAYQVHAVIKELQNSPFPLAPQYYVSRLGGPERAARKLSIYLCLPRKLTGEDPGYLTELHTTDRRFLATRLLVQCGKPGVAPLLRAVKDSDPRVRKWAASALGGIGPAAREAVPALVECLSDTAMEIAPGPEHSMSVIDRTAPMPVCGVAAEALGRIGPDAEAAIPALTKLLDYWDDRVRKAAADAITKIRPKPPE